MRAVAQRLDDLRRSRTATERELDESRERSRRTEIEEAEARMRLEAAVEGVRRDLDTEPEAAEAAELPALPEGTSAPARVRDLDRELKLMGPINPLALEEVQFSRTPYVPGGAARRREDDAAELTRVITAVDTEIQTVFAQAFADVSTNFSELFALLFPGVSVRSS